MKPCSAKQFEILAGVFHEACDRRAYQTCYVIFWTTASCLLERIYRFRYNSHASVLLSCAVVSVVVGELKTTTRRPRDYRQVAASDCQTINSIAIPVTRQTISVEHKSPTWPPNCPFARARTNPGRRARPLASAPE